MTSTRVLCGYLRWSPTSGDSPLHASETLRRAVTSMGRAYSSRPRRDDRTSDAPSPPIKLPERNPTCGRSSLPEPTRVTECARSSSKSAFHRRMPPPERGARVARQLCHCLASSPLPSRRLRGVIARNEIHTVLGHWRARSGGGSPTSAAQHNPRALPRGTDPRFLQRTGGADLEKTAPVGTAARGSALWRFSPRRPTTPDTVVVYPPRELIREFRSTPWCGRPRLPPLDPPAKEET